MYDKKSIIVATNAFGMGIDKSNVSFVVHYNMPKNLESYYQEAGRAGRDGAPADCLLLYSKQDVGINEFLINLASVSDELDEEMLERVKSNDRKLLRKMTMYCETNDCLREYILNYFGDIAKKTCDNCGNCIGDYEKTDVTISAQKILSCVHRLNGVFGVNMIIDILRGSKTKRIINTDLQNQSTYGIMARVSGDDIRAIINELLLSGHIIKTDSKYPVLEITEKAKDVLFHDEAVVMKVLKNSEEEIYEKKSKPKRHSRELAEYPDVDMELFERLKAVRMEIATAGSVPAFVVFTNKTLLDMCDKLPKTQNDFLGISGVGNMKAERYSNRFLQEIEDYISGD